ncbi:hypothetical protein MIND_00272600 [Mycena indigotica]|uniref:Uncharacterized protein n=1 Tax=Mycena indigotica TaxID=2126181 RepID=A0A8H6T7Y8_9AGAR|nr:uncharacterized protein MIND_00272600 [Mycena indigotica]KAF7312585.1 hypothetical protein MIND_00272600 [Mycena indigotica]
MLLKLTTLTAILPSILAANITVTVGQNNGLTFTPAQITAAIGDVITFTVLSRDHSITTTNFAGTVCPPPDGGVGPNGFDSGLWVICLSINYRIHMSTHSLSDLDGSQPNFRYTVVDAVPHFGACKQAAGGHCRAGMTFAINPNSTFTYTQFLANARAS